MDKDKIRRMLENLVIIPAGQDFDLMDIRATTADAVAEIWERQNADRARMNLLEAAMDRISPDWRSGPSACSPYCRGACCNY